MLCAGLFTKAQASVENFLWAIGTVNARNWGIDSPSGGGKINVMAPVADLFNHRCDFGVGGWELGVRVSSLRRCSMRLCSCVPT